MSNDYLAKLNPHPRDKDITFEEGPHIYTVLGDRGGYTSVTTFNHTHFSHFEADAIIDNIVKSRKWDTDPAYKYYKMSKDAIKDMWEQKRDTAAQAGTKMHYDIECYYNKRPVENDSLEYKYFMEFLKDYPELEAYRTEWMVFHEELKISGSIDMIYENPDGTLQIYDWKRAEEIKSEPEFGKYAITPCLSHLPDTNFWHYALQLNLYKLILEEKYGKQVTGLYLIRLHPINAYKSYERIQVPFLTDEMRNLKEYRKKQLMEGKTKPH